MRYYSLRMRDENLASASHRSSSWPSLLLHGGGSKAVTESTSTAALVYSIRRPFGSFPIRIGVEDARKGKGKREHTGPFESEIQEREPGNDTRFSLRLFGRQTCVAPSTGEQSGKGAEPAVCRTKVVDWKESHDAKGNSSP